MSFDRPREADLKPDRPISEVTDQDTAEWTLLAVPHAVGLLRDCAEVTLIKWDLSDLVEDTTLVVSELATNCVSEKVARGREITLRLAYLRDSHLLSVEVTDPSRGRPEVKHAADTDIHGRGLFIVQALSTAMGYREEAEGGKTTWASLSTAR